MAGKLLSAREFAERVSVCPETVRRWARRGQIRPAGRTPGGQLRFHESQVEQVLAEQPNARAMEVAQFVSVELEKLRRRRARV